MLTRRDVLTAVLDYRQANGDEVPRTWPVSDTILAINSQKGTRLLINAYGEEATEDKTFTCVARALHHAACKLYEKERRCGDIIALAFPYTHSFWENVKPLRKALNRLGITCFLVRPNRSVFVCTEGTPRPGPLLVP